MMNYPRVNWHTTNSPCPDQFLAKPRIVRIYVRVLAGQCENQFPKGKLLEGFAQNARFSLEGNRMEKVIPETTASQFRVEPLCYVMHRHSAMLLVKVVVVWSFEVCFCCFSSCLFTHIFGCFMIVIHVISCHILYVFRSNDIYIYSFVHYNYYYTYIIPHRKVTSFTVPASADGRAATSRLCGSTLRRSDGLAVSMGTRPATPVVFLWDC